MELDKSGLMAEMGLKHLLTLSSSIILPFCVLYKKGGTLTRFLKEYQMSGSKHGEEAETSNHI